MLEMDPRKFYLKRLLLTLFLLLILPAGMVLASPIANPDAALVGKAIGYAISGQKYANTKVVFDKKRVQQAVSKTIQDPGFFFGGVGITAYEATSGKGQVEGVIIHRDRLTRTIYTWFNASCRMLEKIHIDEVVLPQVRTRWPRISFYMVPAEKISDQMLASAPIPEIMDKVVKTARKVVGKHRPDKSQRDYIIVSFFMEKRPEIDIPGMVLSSKPGSMTGIRKNSKARNENGWCMVYAPARFAFDSGPELFFNLLISDGSSPAKVVNVYSTYSLTKKLQKALTKRGYKLGAVDGQMGVKTRRAIQQFQKDQGLKESDIPSLALLRLLSTPGLPYAVKLAQASLTILGYDPGSADGKMTLKTRNAIKAFQKDRLLVQDSVLSAELVSMMADAVALSRSSGISVKKSKVVPQMPVRMNRFEEKMWPNRIQR